MDEKLSHKYSTQLCELKNEFEKRFADFKALDNDFALMAAAFSFDCSKASDECQMELINLQSDLALTETSDLLTQAVPLSLPDGTDRPAE